MTRMIDTHGRKVAGELADFIDTRALPGTGVGHDAFWRGVAGIFARFAPENAALLGVRDTLQAKIDAWHMARAGAPIDMGAYQSFLRESGFLVAEPAPFSVAPENVDDEVARLAGAQLVVPVLNARFLLNAANARWGSLYDALYGTDAVERPAAKGPGYDAERGAAGIAEGRKFLDAALPLFRGSWADLTGPDPAIPLADVAQLVGETDDSIEFRHNGLLIQVVFNELSPIG